MVCKSMFPPPGSIFEIAYSLDNFLMVHRVGSISAGLLGPGLVPPSGGAWAQPPNNGWELSLVFGLLKLRKQHKLIFQEQILNIRCEGVV